MPKCPICGKEAAPRSQNKAFPFCSPRCKQVDLGKWLNEEYRVPVSPDEVEDETPPPPVENGHGRHEGGSR